MDVVTSDLPIDDGDGIAGSGGAIGGRHQRTFVVTAIGHVATTFTDPAGTPIQAQRGAAYPGRVYLDEPYRSGLTGLDGFDYAHLVTYLDRPIPPKSSPDRWTVEPFLLGGTGQQVGTFATRHPTRPNPIALSLVRIIALHNDGFDFVGVDLLDQTPLLDIKPWVPQFDTPEGEPDEIRTGWYGQPDVLAHPGATPAELHDPARPTPARRTP